MLQEMGVATGIDLEASDRRVARRAGVLGRPLGAHVLRAGPVDWRR